MKYLKAITFTFLLLGVFLFSADSVNACDAATVGKCLDGFVCKEQIDVVSNTVSYINGDTCGGGNLGSVRPPIAIQRFNNLAGGGGAPGIGLIIFLNQVITVINIIAGIFVLFNFIISGWILITSWGKSEAYTQIKDRLTYTFIGIAVVAFSSSLAGVVGYSLYQDATAIVKAQLCSPGSTSGLCR